MLLQQSLLPGLGQIGCHHFLHHFIKRDHRHPAQFLFCLGRIAEQGLDFGRAEVARVDADYRDFRRYGLRVGARNDKRGPVEGSW